MIWLFDKFCNNTNIKNNLLMLRQYSECDIFELIELFIFFYCYVKNNIIVNYIIVDKNFFAFC